MGELIITDQNLKVVPQKTVYRTVDELISFADLLLRWPFQSFYWVSFFAGLDTPEDANNYRLQMRLAYGIGLRRKTTEEMDAAIAKAQGKDQVVDETDIVIALWDCRKNWHRLNTLFTNADMIYFDLAEVEDIEREHPECRIIDIARRDMHPLFVTTPKNIREIGALTLYHWEIIGGIRGERYYYRDDGVNPNELWQMSDTIHFPEDKILRQLPRDRTWPDLPTIRPKAHKYKRNNELAEPQRRIGELRRLGIREKRKLADCVFMLFPNLTQPEIGQLLPGSEGTVLSYKTARDRGRDLLGKKKRK